MSDENNEFTLILNAIEKNDMVFRYLSKSLTRRKDFVKQAIISNGAVLQWVEGPLATDHDFILGVLKENSPDNGNFAANGFLCHELLTSSEFLVRYLALNPLFLDDVHVSCKKNPVIVTAAITKYIGALEYADECLRGDAAFMMIAVKLNRRALKYGTPELKSNHDFVLEALKATNVKVLKYADPELLNDRDFIADASKVDPGATKYAGEHAKDGGLVNAKRAKA